MLDPPNPEGILCSTYEQHASDDLQTDFSSRQAPTIDFGGRTSIATRCRPSHVSLCVIPVHRKKAFRRPEIVLGAHSTTTADTVAFQPKLRTHSWYKKKKNIKVRCTIDCELEAMSSCVRSDAGQVNNDGFEFCRPYYYNFGYSFTLNDSSKHSSHWTSTSWRGCVIGNDYLSVF